jgi:hypothetical protein
MVVDSIGRNSEIFRRRIYITDASASHAAQSVIGQLVQVKDYSERQALCPGTDERPQVREGQIRYQLSQRSGSSLDK